MTASNNMQQPKTELLKQVWRESGELIAKHQAELSQLKLDQLLGAVFSNGPSYYYVFELADLQLLLISDSVQQIHGLDPTAATFQDILDQIHPDDMAFVARAEDTAIRMFRDTIGMGKIKKYKISYNFRFRIADGSYRLFNHQSLVLATDEKGRVGKSLNIHTDISHITGENSGTISLIGMDDEPSYLDVDVDADKLQANPRTEPFSERESTIIRLIAAGLTSAQIAKELSLSEFTIKNHRKRILKKSGCQNMSQLLGSCLINGLI